MLNNLNISEKLQTIAENVQRVYDAGVKNGGGGGITPSGSITITENGTHDVTEYAEAVVDVPSVEPTGKITITENGNYNVSDYAEADVNIPVGMDREEFWNSFQQNGERTRYSYAFSYGWDDDTFTPLYVVTPTENYLTCMFEQSGVTFVDRNKADFSKATSLPQVFRNAKSLTDVDIDVARVGTMVQSFLGATALKNLTMRNIQQNCTFNNTFSNCTSLENLVFENCYIAKEIAFTNSPLTRDSLINLINALENLAQYNMSATLAIGDTNIGKLSEEELAVARGKGWSIV